MSWFSWLSSTTCTEAENGIEPKDAVLNTPDADSEVSRLRHEIGLLKVDLSATKRALRVEKSNGEQGRLALQRIVATFEQRVGDDSRRIDQLETRNEALEDRASNAIQELGCEQRQADMIESVLRSNIDTLEKQMEGNEETIERLNAETEMWKAKFHDAERQAALRSAAERSAATFTVKAKAILKELKANNFDHTSQLLSALVSENTNGSRALAEISKLICEHSRDKPALSSICAKLCQKMISDISESVGDDSIAGTTVPVNGGRLFRRHLLASCQEVFERRWSDGPWAEPDADSYQRARAANYRAFQLGPFIGELFRLRIMPGSVVHDCIRQLLVEGQEGVGCLSRLLVAAGDKACMLEGWVDQHYRTEVVRLQSGINA